MFSRLLFRLSRNRVMDRVVRFGFAHLSALLPVRRVRETPHVIAFHHPRPAWKRHILFVPKVAIPSLLAIRSDQVAVVQELIALALEVAAREPFGQPGQLGFALLANGGVYQDVGQLHFHLVWPPGSLALTCPSEAPQDVLLRTPALVAFHHPQPRRETHVVMMPPIHPGAANGASGGESLRGEFVAAVLEAVPALVRSLGLTSAGKGFTLVFGAAPGKASPAPCVHLMGGDKRA